MRSVCLNTKEICVFLKDSVNTCIFIAKLVNLFEPLLGDYYLCFLQSFIPFEPVTYFVMFGIVVLIKFIVIYFRNRRINIDKTFS